MFKIYLAPHSHISWKQEIDRMLPAILNLIHSAEDYILSSKDNEPFSLADGEKKLLVGLYRKENCIYIETLIEDIAFINLPGEK